MSEKRQNGQYYTRGNPFEHTAFLQWARDATITCSTVLEPFAGANSLIDHLEEMELCHSFASFDIAPASRLVEKRDTLASFPEGYHVCVTNPPWLAKNSATYRGMNFPDCPYDDLYKYALQKCLDHCLWVAALVPESFICAGLFQDRLTDLISLHPSLFSDTNHPVGLGLFGPTTTKDIHVWHGTEYINTLAELEAMRPVPDPQGASIRFNDPNGNVGLIALDNTRTASIRYCPVEELSDYTVKPTGRHITKLQVDGPVKIQAWNETLASFRSKTRDVLMTSYKGIRQDGRYRRRLDWGLARGIIHSVTQGGMRSEPLYRPAG